jgi:hypothetical protein
MAEQGLDQLRSYVTGILARDGEDLESAKSRVNDAATHKKLASIGHTLDSIGASSSHRFGDGKTAILSIQPPDPSSIGLEFPIATDQHTERESNEAIVSRYRPVFAIKDDKVDPTLSTGFDRSDVQLSAMAQLIVDRAADINAVLPAVGRIDLPDNENQPWAGTGWLLFSDLGRDIIITNAHVAEEFVARSGRGFVFTPLPYLNRLQTPMVDFKHEIVNDPARRPYNITGVLFCGTPGKLDVALLTVDRRGTSPLAAPIALSAQDPAEKLPIVALGYPGTDGGNYDAATLLRVFGNVFETKRASPGRIVTTDTMGLSHDCSTMPGSSGTLLFDPTAKKAVGLHFQGIPFVSNHAVPASVILNLLRTRPWVSTVSTSSAPDAESRVSTPSTVMMSTLGEIAMNKPAPNTGCETEEARFTVPLEISVRFGKAQLMAPSSAAVGVAAVSSAQPLSALEATAKVQQSLQGNKNVVGVRARLLYEDGVLTNTRGVVIKVRPEASRNPRDYGLQSTLGSVPVAIERVDLETLAGVLARDAGIVPLDSLEAPAKMQGYKRDLDDPKFRLDKITDHMQMTLHVSPEAGWRVMSKFFAGDDYDHLTVGIYNFTAPHIIDAVRAVLQPGGTSLTMTIDRKSDDIGGSGAKANDWPEEKMIAAFKRDAKDRFKWTPASISGPQRLFATSYHIKVGVASKGGNNLRFILSSGNWASSNQPDLQQPIDTLTWSDVKGYDRDWHALVVSTKLATTFRNHLEQDYLDSEALEGAEAAAPVLPELIVPEDYFLEAPRRVANYKAFAPLELDEDLTVQPVLTPDNYPDVVTPFIESARKSVLFINQSFDIKDDVDQIPPHYRGLLDALLERQQKGLDVRIIFRSGYGKEGDIYRNAVEFGFDKDSVRFFGTCHTKGIIVDSEHVLLGSQNWTGAGTQPNRDASILIFDNPKAAKYFKDIFEFDWESVATNRVPPDHGSTRSARTTAGDEEAAVPSGMRLIPWGAWNS